MSKQRNFPSALLPQELSPSELHSNGDFSGSNVISNFISNKESIESLYNGCLFENVQFKGCNFRSSEFTEAKFLNCDFEDVVFDRSDFVLIDISGCEFKRCSFNNAEWREAIFREVDFIDCEFRNTTASLCSFFESSFDMASSCAFIGQSKKYNIFVNSSWLASTDCSSINSIKFFVDNFGLKSDSSFFSIENATYLQHIAGASLSGSLYTEGFIDLISYAFHDLSLQKSRNNMVKVKYLSKICEEWSQLEEVSILARQHLINILESCARSMSDSIILFETLGLIFKVRAFQVEKLDLLDKEIEECIDIIPKNSVFTVTLDTEYTESEHDKILKMARILNPSAMSGIKVLNISKGSIVIDIAITGLISATALFTALGVSLKSIKVVIKESTEVVKASKGFIDEIKPSRRQTKEQDASNSAPLPPALMRVFQIATQDGRTEALSSILEQCEENVFEFNYTSNIEIRSRK